MPHCNNNEREEKNERPNDDTKENRTADAFIKTKKEEEENRFGTAQKSFLFFHSSVDEQQHFDSTTKFL